MFFLEKNKKKMIIYLKLAALLIHAAKIDQDYSEEEEEIIKTNYY